MSTTAPPHDLVPGEAGDADLIGRDEQLARVERLLAVHRLVTIIGQGGVGKTRLAMALAERTSDREVSWCELVPVPDPGGVATAIVESLGFPSLEAAAVRLEGRPRLLVVDNAENHLDAVSRAVEAVLLACVDVTVLATSQEPLELPREHVVVLEPLPVPIDDEPRPAASSPAVQLFLARSRAAGARFGVDEEVEATLAAIVRRLDGLPLAIELAAARTRSLTPQDILRHLDTRFELLTRQRARGPERHRSLEATIGWSYERLDPAGQRFFARLGTFNGPFTLEAAHSVAADPDDPLTTTIDRLDALVSRSLVSPVHRPARSGYLLPESIRLFALRRRDETADGGACDIRCVDHFVGVTVSLIAEAQHRWSTEVIQTLFGANQNLQHAIRWCLVADETSTRSALLFLPLWGLVHNGRAESVRQLGERILERWPEPQDESWTATAAITATASLVSGHLERGQDLAAQVRRVTDEGLGALLAARAQYLAASHAGDHDDALDRLATAATIAESEDLGPYAVELELFRALTQARRGEVSTAIATAEQARDRAIGCGEILQMFAHLTLGAIVAVGDDLGRGRAMVSEALEVAEGMRYPWGIGSGHRALGAIDLAMGDLTAARVELSRSLDTFLDVGQLGEVAGTLRWVAGLLVASGRPEDPAELIAPVTPSPPLLAALEDRHLLPLIGDVPTRPTSDLRSMVATARAALAEIEARATPTSTPALGGTPNAPLGSPPAGSVEEARWIREGAIWALTFAGQTVRLPDAKGLSDLARLLGRPGSEISAMELMGGAVDSSDLGPLIDGEARRAYERRIIELQEELEEAEGFADLRRAERARAELDELIDALTAATGLGGRSRHGGSSTEKARSAVTRRIRDTIRRVGDAHPVLGEHLVGAVRTGRWCSYTPPLPVAWIVGDDLPR